MKKLNLFIPVIIFIASALIGCKENDPKPDIAPPTTYAFSRNGSSTVSFGGQTTRIQMATQLVEAFKVNTSTAQKLQDMFNHQKDANDFTGTNAAALNASDKTD